MGPIGYYPNRGFQDYQIASNDETSLEPLMALYFEDPPSKFFVTQLWLDIFAMTKQIFLVENIKVAVECKLWTKHTEDKLLFEVLVDEPSTN